MDEVFDDGGPPSRRAFLSAGAGLAGSTALVGGTARAEPAAAPQAPPEVVSLTLTLNGRRRTLRVDPRISLLDALREELGLTGPKKGCDQGACGACTVLLEGRRILSCLTFAVMFADAEVTTVEGLADGDRLHPVQRAFIDHDGLQCGFCTSGQVTSAVGLLEKENPRPSRAEIRELMSGNLCRCAAYPNIVAAVEAAAARTSEERR